MAKRRKVSGNPPRGLSKRDRQAYDHAYRSDDHDLKISLDMNPDRNVSRRPSSTRKKLVKEGNPKFIGPRQLRGMVREDVASRNEDLDFKRGKYEGDQLDYMINNLGATRSRQSPKLRAPELRRLSLDDYNPNAEEHSYGRGGIAKSKRLKLLLARLMDRHLGGGQEFDRQD